MSSIQSHTQQQRIIRLPEVCELTGLCKSTLYKLRKLEQFVAPVQLTKKSIGWRLTDVMKWIESRNYQ